MKIKPLKNCGVEIVDIDISNLTLTDYKEIKDIFLEHLVVIFRNQSLQIVPYAKLIEGIGHIANWKQCQWDIDGNLNKYYTGSYVDPFTFVEEDKYFPVQRVTGKKIEGKMTGIFGSGKLDWHSNMNGPFNRARGVALQGVTQACVGTSTSWMDTTLAYAAMSDELKKRCEGVEGRFEYSPEIWAEGLPQIQYDYMLQNKEEFYMMPLVNISPKGKPGLYFHFHNKCTFPSDPELLDILKEHCFKPEFIYKHEWEIGDIVLSDQVLTLHKRDHDDPAILAERVLHRYTFHFDPK
jgi:alpha-ketoglutarate-dependent taurine dioxygenase